MEAARRGSETGVSGVKAQSHAWRGAGGAAGGEDGATWGRDGAGEGGREGAPSAVFPARQAADSCAELGGGEGAGKPQRSPPTEARAPRLCRRPAGPR